LHGIHAITSRLSPVGSSSGVQVIEGESFKMNILLTVTGLCHDHQISAASEIFHCPTGTKFVLLTSLAETVADTVLQKIYDIYADAVMKNPFHTPEMPIRNEGFDTRINSLIGTGQT
jgi:hypothetical protein